MKLLCLSNGHGEDIIAVQILEQLQRFPNAPQLAALPIVGEGYAYHQANIPILGPVQQMPSGGFIYMDSRQLWRDVRGGLVQLTLAQYKAIRRWGKSGGKILAVGDFVPLILAWLSGASYAFVGTAKSEYYLRDESGWLSQTSQIEKWLGSYYYPWERWLMQKKRCKAVFPRDTLTTEILQQWSIPALNCGNPMIDGVACNETVRFDPLKQEEEQTRPLKITLLPGSRPPEAYKNWQIILQSIPNLLNTFQNRSLVFLGAIAPSLNIDPLQEALLAMGWSLIPNSQTLAFSQKNATLFLNQDTYAEYLNEGDVAIAMAGTATEQFVGLGKPAFAIPGSGPQYTPRFAEAQTRLLGASLILVPQASEIAQELQSLLNNPDRLQWIAENGQRRLGKPGAAQRIAENLIQIF